MFYSQVLEYGVESFAHTSTYPILVTEVFFVLLNLSHGGSFGIFFSCTFLFGYFPSVILDHIGNRSPISFI